MTGVYEGFDRHTVLEQLEWVRAGGETNMMDRAGVRRTADAAGMRELVEFVNEKSAEHYMEALEDMGARRGGP